ncbi:MAG TPA: ATP synthase F1 subunit epsilon [Solirubrobacterales bacterium]|nr:ATP synthase F1 subunit epsilon [Solirubrobacterales bacterium]
MAEEHTFRAQVLTPEGPVYDGEVRQLSTRTAVGEVGILANHAPLVGRLVPAELRIHVSDSETIRYAQAEGWLEVFANKAVVLIGEAIPPDELDPSELKQRLEDAERRLAESEEDSASHDQAERDKARAEAFLEVAE